MLLQAIVFITGGAILALELLASRILTPYFGVSLYIWTGILSITLVSLALGYWAGGRFASDRGRPLPPDRLVRRFILMPAIAAFAVVAACMLYPYLFHELARLDLVIGAFIACMLLLFVPLLATSAMNPLLVALFLQQRAAHGVPADAGAGRVFFVSTIGSVAGVLITAFGLIPYLGNFAATLVIAAVLAVLPLAAIFAGIMPLDARKSLGVTAGVALASALGLLASADAYTGRMWPATYGGQAWKLEASYRSLFGTVKVLRSEARDDGRFARIYFQDGLIQNMVSSDNKSMSLYTYALEALSYAYRPKMRSALVLGLGAGMVPMRLAGNGVKVESVDIDPASLRAATDVFGFDPALVRAHQADARTFLRDCKGGYDVVIVDLFHGDGVPDYLVTRDFFRDLKRCVGRDGIAVFNTFADLDHPRPYAHFLTTLRAELPFIVLYRPDYGLANHINSFVVASDQPLGAPASVAFEHVPQRHAATLASMLRQPRPLDLQLLEHGRVITDARNAMPADFARSQMINRRYLVDILPAAFFLN